MAYTTDSTYPPILGTAALNDAGYSRNAQATVTRPANATPYSANQVITATGGGALVIPNVVRVPGKGALLLSVQLIDAVFAATPLQPVIWLFNSPPTSLVDGATLALTLADAVAKIGVIPLYQTYPDNSTASPSGIRTFQASTSPLVIFPPAGTTIYAYIVTGAAYTPISAETFTLVLGLSQD